MIRRLENFSEGQKNHLAELKLKAKALKTRNLEMRERFDKEKKFKDEHYLAPNGTWKSKIKTDYSNVGIGEDVKEMTTKKLLSELHDIRFRYCWWNDDVEDEKNEEYELQLRAELNTREHLPKKDERKKIRQEAAKRKK